MSVPQSAGSSDAVIQTLKWARKQGFKPVPLRKQSKAALDARYVEDNYVPPADDLWTNRDLGVGVLLGPRAAGPTDVDLDCPEAVFFASRFLPPTAAVFGRKSKRASHYLYRPEVEALAKKAFMDPISKSTIVEIRGDGGHHTVFPGSLHEATGEAIEWEDRAFPDVPKVSPDALELATKKVAIATLIARHMFMPGQRNEVNKLLAGMFYYVEWPEEDVKSLMDAVMEYTDDDPEDRKSRLKTIRLTYQKGESGGKITGATALKKFLGDDRAVDRIQEWCGNEIATLVQEYNDRFAVVTMRGKFRIAETQAQGGEPPTFYPRQDFLYYMEPDSFTALDDKGRPKRISKAEVWLKDSRRRLYTGVTFKPGVEDCAPQLNMWTGWGVPSDESKSCARWKDLLFYVICGGNDDTYKWMINWFGNMVRTPLDKPLTSPCIVGGMGAGKSLLFNYFGDILGPSYRIVTKEEHVVGKFNAHMANTLLLHSEEALYGGDKRHAGIIRELITGKKHVVEFKGLDIVEMDNYARLVLTGNNMRIAPTGADERRFTIINLDRRKVSPALAAEILDERKKGGPSGLLHFLTKELDYEPSVIQNNLKNEDLANLKKMNFEPVVSWWYDCLTDGQFLPDYLSWACKPAGEEWPTVVSSPALHMAMRYALKGRKHYVPDSTTFALMMNKIVGKDLRRAQKWYSNPMSDAAPPEVRLMSNRQSTVINMPTLEECRQAFTDYIGQAIAWPDPVPDEEKPAYQRF